MLQAPRSTVKLAGIASVAPLVHPDGITTVGDKHPKGDV